MEIHLDDIRESFSEVITAHKDNKIERNLTQAVATTFFSILSKRVGVDIPFNTAVNLPVHVNPNIRVEEDGSITNLVQVISENPFQSHNSLSNGGSNNGNTLSNTGETTPKKSTSKSIKQLQTPRRGRPPVTNSASR